MTDERYVYVQDLKEKNSTKSGAYHKRSGKKSRYVGLPSDHLTAAQLKRRNGPVETVKLNTPMTYKELKKLTPTLQFLYLDECVTRYKARRKDLVAMLCISQSYWNKFIPTLPGRLDFTDNRRKSPAPEWLAFISPKPAPEIPTPAVADDTNVTPAPAIPVVIETPVLIAKPEVNPYRVTLEMNGTLSQLSDLIAVLTDSQTTYNFAVTITAGKEDV